MVRSLLVHVNEVGMRVRHFRLVIHAVSRFAQGQRASPELAIYLLVKLKPAGEAKVHFKELLPREKGIY